MIGKIVGAELGRRLAGRNNGLKGALIGAAVPWLVRRAMTPAGIAIIGAIVAKAVMDGRASSRNGPGQSSGSRVRTYPARATA